jgi:hypothetical protein
MLLSSNAALDSALKGMLGGAAVGSVIGLVVGTRWTTKRAPQHRPILTNTTTTTTDSAPSSSTVTKLTGSAVLRAVPNVYQYLERLMMYNKFGRDQLRDIIHEMENATKIVADVTQQNKGTFTLCSKLASHQAKVVEAIRMLRARMTNSDGIAVTHDVLSDFDDIAAGLQSACNDNAHNVTMITQSNMMG